MKKRLLSLLLCLALLCAGCAPAQAPQQSEAPALSESPATEAPAASEEPAALFTAGTYPVTVTGHNGPMTVEVTFGENTIEAIAVTAQSESPALGTVAMDDVTAQILANQSLDVDMVAGATISGAALLQAVKTAVADAGGDAAAFSAPVEREQPSTQDVTCDVVVVGSGSAGMAAAAEAGELGLNVILVEQLGLLGGSSVRTGFLNGGGTKVQAEKGISYTTEQMVDYFVSSGEEGDPLYNAETARLIGEEAGKNIDWLYETVGVSFGEVKNEFQHRGPNAARLGPYLISGLQSYLDQLGVEYRLNTTAKEILMENGAVSGLRVENAAGPYTIHTKNVILATGGYFGSQEMVAQYNPAFVGYPTDVCKGADGSGMKMAESVGGVLIEMDKANYHGIATTYNGGSRSMQTAINSGAIIVNAEGKRFVNEKAAYETVAFAVLEQTDGHAFCILDQTLMDYDSIKNDVGLSGITEMYTKADTLEELVEKMGIDAEGLKATLESYKTYVANGEDAEFGRAASSMNSDLSTPPYYAVLGSPETHTVKGGVVVDQNAHALDSQGAQIPGLYAAGEVAASHVNGASTNTVCVVMGRIAAQQVAESLK